MAFAALHLRGQSDFESLSEAEQLRWVAWLHTWITQTEDAWPAHRHGIPDMEWVDSYLLGIALVLRSTWGRIVWPRMRPFFDAAFAEAMDERIAEETVTQQEAMLGPRAAGAG